MKRITPNAAPSTFLGRRFFNTDHKTFSFFSLWNTKLSRVLVRGFREVGEIVVRIVDEHRVIIHGSDLVELLELITCVEGGLAQIAKLLVLVT